MDDYPLISPLEAVVRLGRWSVRCNMVACLCKQCKSPGGCGSTVVVLREYK